MGRRRPRWRRLRGRQRDLVARNCELNRYSADVFEGRNVAVVKGVALRRKNLQNPHHVATVHQGHRRDGTNAQALANLRINARINLRIHTTQGGRGGNALCGEAALRGDIETGAVWRRTLAATGTANHVTALEHGQRGSRGASGVATFFYDGNKCATG